MKGYLDQLFKDFCDAFRRQNWQSKCDDFPELTPYILSYFREKGEKEGFESHDYLVDKCWTTGYYDKNAVGYWIELAMESELSSQSRGGIWEDFVKLMDVKANIKVGVFRPAKAQREEILDMLRDELDCHRIKNPQEEYLIILLFYRTDKTPVRLEISGYRFDYLGNYEKIGSELLPWE